MDVFSYILSRFCLYNCVMCRYLLTFTSFYLTIPVIMYVSSVEQILKLRTGWWWWWWYRLESVLQYNRHIQYTVPCFPKARLCQLHVSIVIIIESVPNWSKWPQLPHKIRISFAPVSELRAGFLCLFYAGQFLSWWKALQLLWKSVRWFYAWAPMYLLVPRPTASLVLYRDNTAVAQSWL